MAVNTYRDFVLVVDQGPQDPASQGQISVTVFSSPAGEWEASLQVVPGDLQRRLNRLERRGLDVAEIIALGETLADLLFPDPVRDLLWRSMERLKPEEGLRVRLRLDPGLVNIPWEYVYLQRGGGEKDATGFLALDPRISIARHEALPLSGDLDSTPRPRRLLVALAGPSAGFEALDLSRERMNIELALQEIPGILPTYLEHATTQTLADQLLAGADIFHFAGHGEFQTTGFGDSLGSVLGEGAIILEGPDSRPAPMPAEQLAINLRGRGVQLVVLGACQTGRRDAQNVWSGVVAALMESGIPAAVAMQFKIWDEAAIAFSRSFYRALAAGLPLDQAITTGRLAVFNLCHPLRDDPERSPFWQDWGVPVLYLRAAQEFLLPAIADDQERDAALADHRSVLEPVRRAQEKILEETRRLDAAMPSQVTQGRPTEVWTQICLPESQGFQPQLPQYTRSGEEIGRQDVRAGNLSVAFPIDPDSGEPDPIQLRVEVRAPDFQLVLPYQDVRLLPGSDSGLLTFHLTPLEARPRSLVHVTVTQQTEQGAYVTLGSTAIATEIAPTGVGLLARSLWNLVSLPLASLATGGARAEPPPTPGLDFSIRPGTVTRSMKPGRESPAEPLSLEDLQTRFLLAIPATRISELAWALQQLPQARRMRWVILVRLPGDEFAVVSILDLDTAFSNLGEQLWELSLSEVPGLLTPAVTLDRAAADLKEARQMLAENPDQSLVVLDGGQPAGLFALEARKGFLPGGFRRRIFAVEALSAPPEPTLELRCLEDGQIYAFSQIIIDPDHRLICPQDHVIEE